MTKSNVSVKELTDVKPTNHAKASVCFTNHIIEIVITEKRSNYLHSFKKVNGNMYVDKRTGEVREYSEHGFINRNRSFTRLRRYVNANFTGKQNEVFVTLTYSYPQFNRSQVSADMKNFWKRFKYRYKNCEYISIIEPHKSGAWHIHMLIKDMNKRYLWINKNKCCSIWKHGNIKIERIKKNDNIGAYFTALCKSDSETESKSSRLKYYPKYSKVFSHSSNIKKPIYKIMSYENAMKLVENHNECFSKTIGIFDDNEQVNTIFYKQYNSKRNRKGE